MPSNFASLVYVLFADSSLAQFSLDATALNMKFVHEILQFDNKKSVHSNESRQVHCKQIQQPNVDEDFTMVKMAAYE